MVQFAPLVLLATAASLAGTVTGAPSPIPGTDANTPAPGAGIGTTAAYTDAVMDLQRKGRTQLDAALAQSKTCTKEKLMIRKEYGDLTLDERKNYVTAMLCLMSKPPKLTQFPGVTNRYEDFVAVHINQTLSIHGTGSFLSWHRYYTWAFEQALRTECGYTGTQPYWDWGRWAKDPLSSPIFDGSDTSLSGNGQKISHRGQSFGPAGDGGGCVTTGPFKNMTINLGPFAAETDPAPKANPQSNGMGKNPRCLRRDMSNYLTSRYGRTEDIVALITNSKTIGTFQDTMQATSPTGGMGVHGVGHFTIAGDPGADFYQSPNDPGFWVHHGMIDRTWSIWQTQQLTSRTQVIAGGTSMMGFGSKQQSLEDVVDLGVVNVDGKTWKIKELVSTVDGPFCYTYE